MGILLCEQNFRDVWVRNKSVRAEIGQILHTDTHPHTHTTAAKLVVRMSCKTSLLSKGVPPDPWMSGFLKCCYSQHAVERWSRTHYKTATTPAVGMIGLHHCLSAAHG